MDGDVPGLLVAVDEIPHQSVTIAIEVDADQLAGPAQDRTAGVAADGVGRRYEVEWSCEVKSVSTIHPARRQLQTAAGAPGGPNGRTRCQRSWRKARPSRRPDSRRPARRPGAA